MVLALHCTKDEGLEAAALLYLTTTEWDPDYATWEKATRYTNWKNEGGDYSEEQIDSVVFPSTAAGNWQDFDVTTVVKDFLNNPDSNLGFYVKMSLAMTGINYASSEYEDKTKRPKIKIMHGEGDYEPPQITVQFPDGGEVFIEGTKEIIKWNATDNEQVAGCVVYFRRNNWTGYSVLDSLDGNPGEYEWTVPEGDFWDCKIKVIAFDAVGNVGKDESDESFEIEKPSAIIPFSLKNNSTSEYFITITNIQGRIIASYNTLDLNRIGAFTASLPSGIHIIHIKTSEQSLVKKYKIVR